MRNNQKRFPTSLLKDGDPNNYLTRAWRDLVKKLKEFGGVNNDTDAMQIIDQALKEKPK